MVILSEVPAAQARAALDRINDAVLDASNAGTDITVRLPNGAGMSCRYVLCGAHPEVRPGEERVRIEVLARIDWRGTPAEGKNG